MSRYFALSGAKDQNPLERISYFAHLLLETGSVGLFMAPQPLSSGHMVQHVLLKDPNRVRSLDPIAPVLPVNGAVLAARLTRQDPGVQVGVLLRPCEIRAFVELLKLRQGNRDRILLVGIDCFGTFEPPQYRSWIVEHPEGSLEYLDASLKGESPADGKPTLRRCCEACEFPAPEEADVGILLLGTEGPPPIVKADTPRGNECLRGLGLTEIREPAKRQSAVSSLIRKREDSRDRLFEEVEKDLLPLNRLLDELASCINCHNCKNACPVCYCKGCVFDGQSFEHQSTQYLRWVDRKGAVKMPTDTLFFHLTRMAHMSTSCVGCGQCSSACPTGIRVAEIFRTVSRKTQGAFGYVAGRALDEPLPLSTFQEDEPTPR